MGIEVKKKLTHQCIRQAVGEFLLFSSTSSMPFIQIATDMEQGGIAWYCSTAASPTGGTVVVQRVFLGMPGLWSFLSAAIQALPPICGYDSVNDQVHLPQFLAEPKRTRLYSQALAASGAAAGPVLEAFHLGDDDDGDVARLSDLRVFGI